MGMIIRVAFNNQNWAGRCKNADRDVRLFKCWEGAYNVSYQIGEAGNCLAGCWESKLCIEYCWENHLGDFNPFRAEGNVYFVYPDLANSLVFWGKSEVKEVRGNKVYFEKFEAMPEEDQKRLGAEDILYVFGSPWRQPPFRYLDEGQENRLRERLVPVRRQR